MPMNPTPTWDPRYVDQLVRLAEENVRKGVLEEPRIYYGVVALNASQPLATQFAANTFLNGDQFPVRLTHLVLAPRPSLVDAAPAFTDERLVQRVGLRLRFHDAYYQNYAFVPAPVWLNKPVAGADAVQRGASSWIFDRPTVLSARDGIRVQVQLEDAFGDPGAASVPVGIGFTGVGLLSKRPYFLSSSLDISDLAIHDLDAADLHNDGGEPIALTDATFICGALSTSDDASGDIRRARFQVKLLGNGTQAEWFKTNAGGGLVVPRAPGQLLGVSTGRSIVHRFPGDGMLLEPGEGFTAEAEALDASTEGMQFCIAAVGYISIT